MSRMSPAIAEVKAAKPKARKVMKSMEIERSMDGGHVITHRYQGYEHEPTPYKFAKSQGAMAAAHVAKHAGLPMPGASEDPDPNDAEE